MELFSKETINKKRKQQTRDLTVKNDKLIASLRKILKLQNDIDFDTDKARKVEEYRIWCNDLQIKQSKLLETLEFYKGILEEKKEEYYNLIAKKDEVDDKILTAQEELGRLELELTFKRELLAKQ